MSTSHALSFVARSVILPASISLGIQTSRAVSQTLFVRKFTASCDVIISAWYGIQFEFGVIAVTGDCYSVPVLRRGNCCLGCCSLWIGKVAIDMLALVYLWCILGASITLFGAVGMLVVVTGGTGPSLCGCASAPSSAGALLSMFFTSLHTLCITFNTLFLPSYSVAATHLWVHYYLPSRVAQVWRLALCNAKGIGQIILSFLLVSSEEHITDIISNDQMMVRNTICLVLLAPKMFW